MKTQEAGVLLADTNTCLQYLLGYKCFLVRLPEAEQAELVVGQERAALQKLLLETMPEGLISDTLRKKTNQAINSGAVSASAVPDLTQQSSS